MTNKKELDIKVTKKPPISFETGSCFDATNFAKIKVKGYYGNFSSVELHIESLGDI